MAMVQGRFVDTFKGVIPDDQLAAFVDKAVAAAAGSGAGVPGASPGASLGVERAGSDGPETTAAPVQDPVVLVAGAFAALDGGLPSAKEDAARAFSHVLAAGTAAGPATRARAYAGVARCALLASPPDLEGAREMVMMARKIVDNNFTEPEEIGAAAARTELMASAIEAGVLSFASDASGEKNDADGFETEIEALRAEVVAAAAVSDKDAADDARHKLTLRLVFAGDASGAIKVALEMVSKGSRERGRKLCVQIFDALGANDPLTVAGRRRLSNAWFI
uniref:Uncharacterized protein n=1 Tax=Mantoniella antarctica TaxID=81844 RepID=A0A7S0T2B7_9CHLO|mmetsp:Transcript_9070/g.22342  ORF Transcript_9070/g.22342 Transcript_9070/m.22342 type:complete len:278 (+) Transcript_9070:922-1755(+)